MEETKKPWQSKAMWAGVIALIALNAKQLGIVDVVETDQSAIVDIIVSAIEQAAVIAAMIGRYIAKSKLKV